MKTLSQMTKEEKLQALTEYHAYRREQHIVSRYIRAIQEDDKEQTAYFESFGESVHHVVLNVNTYERRLIFGYVDRQFNEYGYTHRPVRERHVCRYGGLVYRHGRRRQPPFGMGGTHYRLQGSGSERHPPVGKNL